MARQKAAPVKSKAGNSARKVGRSAGVSAGSGAHVLTKELQEKLQTLVQQHRSKNLQASWQLGKLAMRVLGHTPRAPVPRTAIAELAETIGLIPEHDSSKSEKRPDESSFRQLMKFARLATKKQAEALQKEKIPWRGVVYWIGVEDPKHRSQLYKAMTKGLTNSTKIRAYIEANFKKKPLPRFSGDCAEDFKKAQSQSDSLASLLDALGRSLDKQNEDCGSARQRRQLTKAMENTRKQINTMLRKLRKRV